MYQITVIYFHFNFNFISNVIMLDVLKTKIKLLKLTYFYFIM